MILVINTADIDQVLIGLVQHNTWLVKKKFTARYRQAELLLPAIDKLLASRQQSLKQLKAVAVVSGPAPFTAVRIGVATANALAWSLGLPVFSCTLTEFASLAALASVVEKKFKQGKNEKVVKPFYGMAPTITLKK